MTDKDGWIDEPKPSANATETENEKLNSLADRIEGLSTSQQQSQSTPLPKTNEDGGNEIPKKDNEQTQKVKEELEVSVCV